MLLEIDNERIEEAITERTKSILLVHLYGRCAYTKKIGELCKKYNLKLVEDNAQAHGCYAPIENGKLKMENLRRTGSIGDAAGHSFYPGKNLGSLGDGDIEPINHLNSIIWTKPNILNKRELHILECYYNVFGTPTSFFSKSLFLQLDGFNEHIPLFEDWPFWVKATKYYKVKVMDRLTVWYRIHNTSISRSDNNNRYLNNLRLCKWNNIKDMRRVSPLFGILGYLDYQIEYHNTIIWRFLGLSRYINPYYYVRKRINKRIFPLDSCRYR